ncbi:hypothetical protein AHAS_Ahas03G0123800 [Arachis hypogaea]
MYMGPNQILRARGSQNSERRGSGFENRGKREEKATAEEVSPHRRRRETAKREKTKKRPRRSREQRGKERLDGDSVAAVSEDVPARQQDGDAGKITGRIHPQRWKRGPAA